MLRDVITRDAYNLRAAIIGRYFLHFFGSCLLEFAQCQSGSFLYSIELSRPISIQYGSFTVSLVFKTQI
jgi:hypothetical protein